MSAPDRTDPARPPCIELLDEAIVEVLRRKTPAERVAMAFDAEQTMRLILEGQLRLYHPEWNAQQVAQEIARRRNLESG